MEYGLTNDELIFGLLRCLIHEPYLCESEEEARNFFLENNYPEQRKTKKWPCLFTSSDTTGEKDFEEFFTENEELDTSRFENLGIIKNEAIYSDDKLNNFEKSLHEFKQNLMWTKEDIVKEFFTMIPDFGHKETGKYLDGKM